MRFQPANRGRPKGARGVASKASMAAIRAMGSVALAKLAEAVQRGEKWALMLVVERLVPRSRTLELEAATSSDVAEALAAGDLSPDEGAALATALLKLQALRAIETNEPKMIDSSDYNINLGVSQSEAAEKYRKLIEGL